MAAVPSPPACAKMGSHCRSLRVLLRVSTLDDGPDSGDHEATWLMGHTERIHFGDLWEDDKDLYADAVLHVPCKFLEEGAPGSASRCRAHGFRTRLPAQGARRVQPRQLSEDRFQVVDQGRLVSRRLPSTVPNGTARSLPVMNGENPCADAPCATADHRQGAACCRDLQVEIMCTTRQVRLESLIRSRKSPYLCKVEREGDYSIEAEVISACGYLGEDGVSCALHGRERADGRPAKPELCSHWPPKRQELHPGCVFAPKARKR